MFVHGPGRIRTHASSILTLMLGLVRTGGAKSGLLKGVGVGVGVGLGVGVGVGVVGGVYWIVRTGGLLLSRESNRFAVVFTDSSPLTSQPKFAAGSFSHDCTSAAICAELQVYVPVAPTDWLALTAAEKAPPCAVQRTVL